MSNNWPRVRLADHVELLSGFAFKSDEYCKSESGIRLLRGDNIVQRGLRWEGAKYWPGQLLKDFSAYELREGDVVVAMDRPWIEAGLKVAQIRKSDVPALLVQRVSRLRSLPELDQNYLPYVLYSAEFTEYILGVQTGTAVPHISGGQIRDFKFPLPPLTVQRRIAGVLGALDDLIETNQQLSRQCEALAQVLAAGSPESTPLSSFATWGGFATVRPSGSVDHFSLPAFDDGKSPDRTNGSTIKSNKQRIDQDCVLVARLNPHIPRVWMVYPNTTTTSLASTEFVPILGDGVPSELIYAVCSAPEYLRQMNALVSGTTGSHQRVDKDALTSVVVPDVRRLTIEHRDAIVSLVREAHACRQAMRELAGARHELLPLLLSGRVSVSAVAA